MDRLGGYFGSDESDDHLDYELGAGDSDREAPPSPVGQDERRMQVRAYNHWASLLGEHGVPIVTDLQPEMLDDFGPYSVLLDLTKGVDDAEIAFLGHELAEECGADAITSINEIPSRSVLSRITDHYMQILANQAPIGFEAEFLADRGVEVQYRGILLPYSSDGATIDYVYGVINWREVADKATADELLLEIDQALGMNEDFEDDAAAPLVLEAPAMPGEDDDAVFTLSETLEDDLGAEAETAYDAAPAETGDTHDTIYDLEPNTMSEPASRYDLPRPVFGEDEDEGARDYSPLAGAVRPNRAVDALGNPIGVPVTDDGQWGANEGSDYDSGIKTAADYGLPDWDEEDEEEDDVDGLIDPLSGEAAQDNSGSLMSMVSRGMKHKKSIDLTFDGPATPTSYFAGSAASDPYVPAYPASGHDAFADEDEEQDEAVSISFGQPVADEDEDEDAIFDLSEAEIADDGADDAPDAYLAADIAEADEDDFYADTDDGAYAAADGDDVAPEGLYDALASARVLAQAALSNEDRSRKTLYAAVSQAYDFSLEADVDPEGYRELIAENGLTMQDRAPMTPIVKLVFGADYDKTRLTEYAAVLSFARREGVTRGGLANFLRHAEGGVKGVVQAERKARREEQGKVVEEVAGVRDALARKLRVLEGVDLADVAEGEGEFALVMVRRLRNGALVVLGEVPEDIPLIEKAARKLLG